MMHHNNNSTDTYYNNSSSSPFPSTPPRHRTTPSQQQPQHGQSEGMNTGISDHHTTTTISNNNMRVVVRIRPMNAEEQRRSVIAGSGSSGSHQAAIYPLQQQPEPEPEPVHMQLLSPTTPGSPTESDVASVDSHSTACSKKSFHSFREGGRKVFSKLRPFRRGGKVTASHSTTSSSSSTAVTNEPTPLACNTSSTSTHKQRSNLFSEERNNQCDKEPKQQDKNDDNYPKICVVAAGAHTNNNITRQFEFDAVYGPAVSQQELYAHCFGESVVAHNLLQGYNTTIMAFGMTGAGKSYTMSEQNGVIYHVVHDIFREITADQHKNKNKQVTVQMSCLEIYTEELRDLLGDENSDSSSTALKLRDNGDSVAVAGLNVLTVDSIGQVRELLDHAQFRRTTGCTRLNERSSRSHAIYSLTVTTTTTTSTDELSSAVVSNTTKAKLTLVDLAGSERIKESGVVGSQRKESIHINKDLFVLAKVITSLHERSGHVPYRDSKLTRLLRDSLGGNCRTVLIACVSPAAIHADESLNTLRYAERTRSITNAAKQNTLDKCAMLTPAQVAALIAETKILKARIANLTRRKQAANDFDDNRGMEFSGLEAKLRRAKVEAKAARDSCNAVASTADRLRERFMTFAGQKGAREGERSAGAEEDVVYRIYCLIQEKVELCDDLVVLSRQIESERLELDLKEANFDLYPSELRKEVSNAQEKVRLLSQSLKENEASLQSILVSLSGERQPDGANNQSQTLQDDRVHRQELEVRCQSLGQDVDFVNSENDILRHQNKRLQDEIQRLRAKLGSSEAQVDPERFDEKSDSESENQADKTSSSEHRKIRSHAEQLLDWADRAIAKGRNVPDDEGGSTIASSLGTDLRPSTRHQSGPIFRSRSNVDESEKQIMISNLNSVEHAVSCPCRESVLSNNPVLVDFYLPKLGIMCSCGRKQEVPLCGPDPCQLVNILRDWQVDFLSSIGIQCAADLVHACAQSSKPLAKEMRQWRKEKGLLSVKSQSCCVALHIWSRTCKAVMNVTKDSKSGIVGRPDFLDVSLSSDTFTVSTLGFCGSVITEPRHFGDAEEALI